MEQDNNQLFPIFLKLNQLRVLLVGAGPVGLEKLSAMLNNASNASITIVALDILPEVEIMAKKFQNVSIENRAYHSDDLKGGYDITIIAVNNRSLSEAIYKAAKLAGILANVADTPDLCDFYLGSIVQKGHLKIAISTNGKSPTMAKRLRQWFETILPEELDSLLENLYKYRNTIKGDFAEKVKRMDALTSEIIK